MGVLVQVLPAGSRHVVADDVRLQARLIEAGTQISYKAMSSLPISVSHIKVPKCEILMSGNLIIFSS